MIPGDLEKRNLTLDFIRGILAISVCLFHFAYGTLSLTDGNLLSELEVRNPFRFHLFFFISGLVIPATMSLHRYTIKRFGRFMLRRWIRLAPAAYVALAGMVVLQLVSIYVKGRPVNGIVFPGLGWNDIAGNLLFHPEFFNSQFYYNIIRAIQIEFEFYILMALVFGFINNNKYYSIGFAMVMLALTSLSQVGAWEPLPIISMLPFFMMGFLLYLYSSKQINITETLVLLILAGACCMFIHGWAKSFSGVAVFFLLLFTSSLYVRPINETGKISYSIFLIHIVITVALDGLYKLFFPVPASIWMKTLFLVIMMGIVIVAALGFYRYVERPFYRMSKTIKY